MIQLSDSSPKGILSVAHVTIYIRSINTNTTFNMQVSNTTSPPTTNPSVTPPPKFQVLLRYAHTIKCTGVQRDDAGRITAVEATCNPKWKEAGGKPPKGVLNWVAAPGPNKSPVKLEVRLYRYVDVC